MGYASWLQRLGIELVGRRDISPLFAVQRSRWLAVDRSGKMIRRAEDGILPQTMRHTVDARMERGLNRGCSIRLDMDLQHRPMQRTDIHVYLA